MGKHKYTPKEFAERYIPLILEDPDISKKALAEHLGISYNTLQGYLDNPDYAIQVDERRVKLTETDNSLIDRSESWVSKTWDIFEKRISDALANHEYEKASQIGIEGLKIVKTQSDWMRTVAAIALTKKQIDVYDSEEFGDLLDFMVNMVCDECAHKILDSVRNKGEIIDV